MGIDRNGPAGLAQRFIEATEAQDLDAIRALLADDAVFWTNVSQVDTDRESRLARIAVEFRTFETFGFASPRIDDFGDGFLIRASAHGSLPRGQNFEFPICIVGNVHDGRIVRLEEYFDPSAVAPILSAMAQSGSD